MSKNLMTYAQLDTSRQTPASRVFEDIYFSPEDGVGESRYHFIEGNYLAERFGTCLNNIQNHNNKNSKDDKKDKIAFTVAETGFGTGLNFLLTADLWFNTCMTYLRQAHNQVNQSPPENRHCDRMLHYISAEKYPIETRQLDKIYHNQGWHNALTQQLLAQYPTVPAAGAHDIFLTNNNKSDKSGHQTERAGKHSIRLTLLLGDAVETFRRYPFVADAWFLDGFAPDKNPQLWRPELFTVMATRSQAGTTFATFTAASAVRRGLQAMGFQVHKGKGFGRKRERLLGYYAPLTD